jgi:hypothetical protein
LYSCEPSSGSTMVSHGIMRRVPSLTLRSQPRNRHVADAEMRLERAINRNDRAKLIEGRVEPTD